MIERIRETRTYGWIAAFKFGRWGTAIQNLREKPDVGSFDPKWRPFF